MEKTIILINGKKRSGKDFSADILQDKLSSLGGADKISFATPLKQIIADTFNIPMEDLETFKNDVNGYGIECKAYPNNQPEVTFLYTNFRTILQRFGTEGMKPVFGKSVWADITYKNSIESDSKYIIIPDFRFYVEHDVFYKPFKEGKIKLVTLKIENSDVEVDDAHASEKELDDFHFDYIIDNTGYTEHLPEYLDSFIDTHLKD